MGYRYNILRMLNEVLMEYGIDIMSPTFSFAKLYAAAGKYENIIRDSELALSYIDEVVKSYYMVRENISNDPPSSYTEVLTYALDIFKEGAERELNLMKQKWNGKAITGSIPDLPLYCEFAKLITLIEDTKNKISYKNLSINDPEYESITQEFNKKLASLIGVYIFSS